MNDLNANGIFIDVLFGRRTLNVFLYWVAHSANTDQIALRRINYLSIGKVIENDRKWKALKHDETIMRFD